jgi:acyl carrier protein
MADHERLDQIQHWLIDACQKLNLPVETPDDDFFEVGGSSLALVRLVAQVETKYSEHALSPDEFIEHSTIREIAASIVRNTEGRAMAAAVEGLNRDSRG